MSEKNVRFEVSKSEDIVTKVPPEAFKAMFYMFSGKPDSKIQVFNRRICIGASDISNLNRKIVDKLGLHSIDQTTTSVHVMQTKGKSIQYGFWNEFEDTDWNIPEETKELAIRWDFLLKLDEYKVPQRHTLTVKITSRPSTKDILQFMFSKDPDDDVDEKELFSVCIARADFISHRLADELVSVVNEWNRSLEEVNDSHPVIRLLKGHTSIVGRTIHWSVPAFVLLMVIAVLGDRLEGSTNIALGAQAIVLAMAAISAAKQVGLVLARQAVAAVDTVGGYCPFKLTAGDRNRVTTLKRKQRKPIALFVFNVMSAVAINIASAVIATNISNSN